MTEQEKTDLELLQDLEHGLREHWQERSKAFTEFDICIKSIEHSSRKIKEISIEAQCSPGFKSISQRRRKLSLPLQLQRKRRKLETTPQTPDSERVSEVLSSQPSTRLTPEQYERISEARKTNERNKERIRKLSLTRQRTTPTEKEDKKVQMNRRKQKAMLKSRDKRKKLLVEVNPHMSENEIDLYMTECPDLISKKFIAFEKLLDKEKLKIKSRVPIDTQEQSKRLENLQKAFENWVEDDEPPKKKQKL